MSNSSTVTAQFETIDYSFVSLAKREEAKIRIRISLRQLLQQGVDELTNRLALSEILGIKFNDGFLQGQITDEKEMGGPKARFRSKVTQIEGIEDILAERLFNEFGTIEALAQATPERLLLVEGIDEVRAITLVEEIKSKLSRQ